MMQDPDRYVRACVGNTDVDTILYSNTNIRDTIHYVE